MTTAIAENTDLPELDVLLLQRLELRDYRVGQLYFAEPLHDELDAFAHTPETVPDGWTTHDRVEIVAHPARGALLLRDCMFRAHETATVLRERIRRVHAELTDLQRRVRRRLDEHPRWKHRPIVLGVGVVVRSRCPDTAIPPGVPADLIVDHTDLPQLEQRINRLFDFFTTPGAEPVESYGPDLISDLTDSPQWIGNFIDETTLQAMHGLDIVEQPQRQVA